MKNVSLTILFFALVLFVVMLPNVVHSDDTRAGFAEQKKFLEERLFPAMSDIAENYPVVAIREKFSEIVSGIKRGEVELECVLAVPKNSPSILASAAYKNGSKVIFLYVPNSMRLYRETGNLDLFKDKLAETFLHEYYHYMHHNTIIKKKKASDRERFRAESEAWWYECKEVIVPMLQAGRLKGLFADSATWVAYDAYKKANGDSKSQAWKDFVKKVY